MRALIVELILLLSACLHLHHMQLKKVIHSLLARYPYSLILITRPLQSLSASKLASGVFDQQVFYEQYSKMLMLQTFVQIYFYEQESHYKFHRMSLSLL